MKQYTIIITISFFSILTLYAGITFSQNIGINTSGSIPNASAILDISSTVQGILIPRMTDAQRQALKDPEAGLMIYNTDTDEFNYYNGSGWYRLPASSISTISAPGTGTGTGIAINTSGNTSDASAILDISATDKGFLIPRTTQGAVTAVQGMIIYNTATNQINYYNGASWQIPCSQLIDNNKGTGAVVSGIGINTTGSAADPSAILDVASGSKGLLIPRMSSANRGAIQTPGRGLMIYDNSNNWLEYWKGSAWYKLDYSVPAQPSAISGPTPICAPDNGNSYSVTNVAGVTYTWSYSGTGFTITSGQGTNAITANFSASATSGTLSCTPSNGCGNGTARTLAITVNTVTASNPGNLSNKCAGEQSSLTFSTTYNAAYTYQWQVSTDGGSTWSNLSNTTPYSGVTTATLTISYPGISLDSYEYRCIVTNPSTGCSKTTNGGTLSISSGCFIDCSNAGTWDVPFDWNNANNSIELWGKGGDGTAGVAATRGGGGGGGGAYAKITNVSLTPNSSIATQVPCGNTSVTTAWVKNNAGTIVVQAMSGSNASGATGGAGGAATSCVGSTRYSGGNGGSVVSNGGGGGGGGGAGPNGAGKNGGSTQANSGGGGGGGANGGSSTAGANSTSSTGGNGGTGGNGNVGGAGSGTGSGAGGSGEAGSGGGAGQVTVTCTGGDGSLACTGAGGGGGGGTRTNAGSVSSTAGGDHWATCTASGGGGGGYSSDNGGTAGKGSDAIIRITYY